MSGCVSDPATVNVQPTPPVIVNVTNVINLQPNITVMVTSQPPANVAQPPASASQPPASTAQPPAPAPNQNAMQVWPNQIPRGFIQVYPPTAPPVQCPPQAQCPPPQAAPQPVQPTNSQPGTVEQNIWIIPYYYAVPVEQCQPPPPPPPPEPPKYYYWYYPQQEYYQEPSISIQSYSTPSADFGVYGQYSYGCDDYRYSYGYSGGTLIYGGQRYYVPQRGHMIRQYHAPVYNHQGYQAPRYFNHPSGHR
jgi:hypothetical protein